MLSLLKHYFMNLHRCNHSYMVKLLYRYDVSKLLDKCLLWKWGHQLQNTVVWQEPYKENPLRGFHTKNVVSISIFKQL